MINEVIFNILIINDEHPKKNQIKIHDLIKYSV